MSQWNETSFSLHVENIKHENNFFQLVAFLLLLTVSLSQRSYTSLFQHVKLCVTIHRRRAILPQTQICKFRRTKFDTHTVLSRHEVLISFLRWPTTAIHKYLLYYCIIYLSTQTYSLAARVYLPVQ